MFNYATVCLAKKLNVFFKSELGKVSDREKPSHNHTHTHRREIRESRWGALEWFSNCELRTARCVLRVARSPTHDSQMITSKTTPYQEAPGLCHSTRTLPCDSLPLPVGLFLSRTPSSNKSSKIRVRLHLKKN